MIILTLKTDQPEAKLGLYENNNQLVSIDWPADRRLTGTIHQKINEILNRSSKSIEDIEGVVCFKGPGSFTGLRIGISVANALAYSQKLPVVAKAGKNWLANGIADLLAGKNDIVATPAYDSSPSVTQQWRIN